jgi:ATP:ADP antiporter, AAA family
VYRGGDALSAWVKRLLDLLGEHPALAMFIGAGIALAWAGTGLMLGRAQRRRESAPP